MQRKKDVAQQEETTLTRKYFALTEALQRAQTELSAAATEKAKYNNVSSKQTEVRSQMAAVEERIGTLKRDMSVAARDLEDVSLLHCATVVLLHHLVAKQCRFFFGAYYWQPSCAHRVYLTSYLY